MDTLTTHFEESMSAISGFEAKPHVAVAVSGGVDSMALVMLMQAWLKQHKGTLTALIVDHGLRPESAEEASRVYDMLCRHGIVSEILTLQLPAGLTSIQSMARDARYAALESWCKAHHVLHLMTAHHGDDQLETMMMRLLRGSGVQGLSAMEQVHYLKHVRLLRPLLGISKQACIHYMQSRALAWVEDASNAKPLYTRNRMRTWLPILEKEGLDVQRGLTLVDNFKRSNDFIHHTLVKWMVAHVVSSPAGFISISLNAILALKDEILFRLVKAVCCSVSGSAEVPRLEEVQRLCGALQSAEGVTTRTLNGCLVLVDKLANKVYFLREIKRIAKPIFMGGDASMMRFDGRFDVYATYNTEHGYYVGVLGVKGVSFLRKLKFDLPKLPVEILRVFPAFYRDETLEELLCVPHMGYYSDASLYNNLRIVWSPDKALAE